MTSTNNCRFRITECTPNSITVNREPTNVEEVAMMNNAVTDAIGREIIMDGIQIEFGCSKEELTKGEY